VSDVTQALFSAIPAEATPASIIAYVEDAVAKTELSIETLQQHLAHERNSLVQIKAILVAVQSSALRQTN